MNYEYLFSKSLHEELKQRIKGHIYCKVVNDILIVRISNREGVEFKYRIEDFSRKLILGYINAGCVANVITKKYINHLINVFTY